MKFREDINGLRAIAVFAVVLFHFKAAWMPGGFAGVDVFFVISGFLMTGIIFKGIEKETFSILKFYVSRANRIVPALSVLCLVLLILGWFYLTPIEYKSLGSHASSSMGFLSNVIYWNESGYFDEASHKKWLLHTWSLSVEWQFYIIYPLVLVSLRKLMSLDKIKITILLATVVGFILCVIATYKWPNASYYLLPTRAWEMMIGGIAYLYPFKNLKEIGKKSLELTGLFLIIFSYLFISKDNYWPGYLALFPVVGTYFIIQAQREKSFITSNLLSQKIGAWSYSIYLWHWPFVVVIYSFSLNDNFIYLGIILSVLLGFLSNKFIENKKFRNDFNTLFSYLKFKPLYMVLAVGLMGSFTFISQGFTSRFNLTADFENIKEELVIPLRSNGYCFNAFSRSESNSALVDLEKGTNCYLGIKGKPTSTLLFGDSYAGHNEPFFDEIFKANNASFQSIVTNWCMPSLTENFTGPKTHLGYKQCLLNRGYLKENLNKYKNIIFAGAWGEALEKKQFNDVESIIERSAKLGINIFIMAAPHKYKKNPLDSFYRSIYFDFPFNIDEIEDNDILMNKGNELLEKLSYQYFNVHFINRELLYEKGNVFTKNGISVPYSLDGAHISMLGSKSSAGYFMKRNEYETIMNYFQLN